MNTWYEEFRPTEVFMDLNGTWDMSSTEEEDLIWAMPSGNWREIVIPQMVGRGREENKNIKINWYRKSFQLDSKIKQSLEMGNRVFIHFGGISCRWRVWFNGTDLLETLDALNPREVDVTELLDMDGENILIIGAANLHGIRKEGKEARGTGRLDRDRDLLAPAPILSLGHEPIVWGEVELWCLPACRVDDIFVRPSFRNKRLDVDIEIQGKGSGVLRAAVYDSEGSIQPVEFNNCNFESTDGEKTQITIAGDWESPCLWEPENPCLYHIEITLWDKDEENILAKRKVRFGFRELWIDGENIMMNGKRLFLARKSAIPISEHGMGVMANNADGTLCVKDQIKQWQENAVNSLRLHIGGFYRPGAFAAYTDELGLMLIPEAAFSFSDRFGLDDSRFWDNYYDYLERWIRRARNHPSIVMWSLCNEVLWCGAQRQNPESARLMYEGEKLAKKLDPTRVIGWDGDWDLPPVGKSETVNIHYPYESSMHWYPTECWDFEDIDPDNPPHIRGYYGKYLWQRGSKPIISGEFSWHWPGYLEAPAAMTKYDGDRAYDWDMWQNRNLHLKVVKWQCDAWRVARFAGINPWYNKERFYELMPLETVVIREQHIVFSSGKTENLSAYILNDTLRDRSYTVIWKIEDQGKCIFSKQQEFSVVGGEMIEFEMTLDIPKVDAALDCLLAVEVVREGNLVNREQRNIRIRPKAVLKWPEDVVLYDKAGNTKDIFTQLGLNPREIDDIDTDINAAGIVIGAEGLAQLSEDKQRVLKEYVSQGGNVLLMGESKWTEGIFDFKTHIIDDSKSNHGWVRADNHRALAGITDDDLGMWRDGDWVCSNALYKPDDISGTCWRTLIDVGSREGLDGAVLVEAFEGKGRYLINQLLFDKACTDLGARAVLASLLNDLPRKAVSRTPVSMMLQKDDVIRKSVEDAKIPAVAWNPEDTSIPLFVNAGMDRIDPIKIGEWVKRGGQVWLMDLNPQNIQRWAAALNIEIRLEECNPPEGCMIYEQHPLLWGISSEELFWAEGYWNERCIRDQEMKRSTRIAFHSINAGKSGVSLIEPAALTKVDAGKGQWLLSTIDFEAGLSSAGKKTRRLINGLFVNFNLISLSGSNSTTAEYRCLAIRDHCNAEFQDDTADADLRFFPVNISGYDLAGLPMPAPPPEEWPSTMIMAGVPFEIIDPRKNEAKSCIRLETKHEDISRETCGGHLKQAEGIQVNDLFDNLHSLHTAVNACGEPGDILWSYVLNYQDGSKAELPVRLDKEVSDWYQPKELSNARVAWRGVSMKLSPIGLYAAALQNPYPERKVLSIDIVSAGGKGVPYVIALTSSFDKGQK
jgi:hypothetical protein